MKYFDKEHLQLVPILHEWVTFLLHQNGMLRNAVEKYGSPLNIHCLQPFTENIKAYSEQLDKLNVKYRVYFARKANKCLSFAEKSAQMEQGVDTASYRELKQCLDAGIAPEYLISTAAVKNRKLMELAVRHGVTMVIDNRDELKLLREIAEELQKDVGVNIRIGGFDLGDRKLHSRFGFLPSEATELITQLSKEVRIHYSGLHFHLNGYSIEDRVAATISCITLIDELKEIGIETKSLDIGGGFLVNYLADEIQWKVFHEELKQAVLGKRTPLTYLNDPLGIIRIDDKLYGEAVVYPYYNEVNKVSFLKSILTFISGVYDRPLYHLLNERGIELRVEPGRSLLDQAGITVAKVAFRKEDSEGNLLVGLEMNRTQLRSSSADFLLDPIHLPIHKEEDVSQSPCHGYLVGAYCLEQEFILKRKIKFERFPEIGDLVAFPNTAGYMMHFFESEAHLFELAKNVFFDADSGTISEEAIL